MDQPAVKAATERFIAALHQLEQGDATGAESLAQLFAADAELTNPLIQRSDGKRQGQEQITAFWQDYAQSFGSLHSDFFEVMSNEHAAGLFWRSRGTDRAGKLLSYEGVSLLLFDEEGKIVRFQGFFDTRELTLREKH